MYTFRKHLMSMQTRYRATHIIQLFHVEQQVAKYSETVHLPGSYSMISYVIKMTPIKVVLQKQLSPTCSWHLCILLSENGLSVSDCTGPGVFPGPSLNPPASFEWMAVNPRRQSLDKKLLWEAAWTSWVSPKSDEFWLLRVLKFDVAH